MRIIAMWRPLEQRIAQTTKEIEDTTITAVFNSWSTYTEPQVYWAHDSYMGIIWKIKNKKVLSTISKDDLTFTVLYLWCLFLSKMICAGFEFDISTSTLPWMKFIHRGFRWESAHFQSSKPNIDSYLIWNWVYMLPIPHHKHLWL